MKALIKGIVREVRREGNTSIHLVSVESVDLVPGEEVVVGPGS